MPSLGNWLVFILLPSFGVIAGGILGATRQLSKLAQSGVQHFAGGVVFAAIATEIIPDVLHADTPIAALVGFCAGVVAMFGMRTLAEQLERRDRVNAIYPLGFIAAVSIDCIIDGVVIGTGFAVGMRQGLLIAASLALEMFFLGLAIANTMRSSGVARWPTIAVCAGLAAVLAVSAVVGLAALAGAPAFVKTTLLAFRSAELLYLVTEELLVRAHDLGETRMVTALFFLGFVAVFATELFA